LRRVAPRCEDQLSRGAQGPESAFGRHAFQSGQTAMSHFRHSGCSLRELTALRLIAAVQALAGPRSLVRQAGLRIPVQLSEKTH
jgi:hypothetical protein